MMRSAMRERGEGKLGLVIGLLVLIAAAMFLVEFIPLLVAKNELKDYMKEQAELAHDLEIKRIRKNVLKEAERLELPLDKENLSVNKKNGRIVFRAQYTLPVEMPFYKFDWAIDEKLDRPYFNI